MAYLFYCIYYITSLFLVVLYNGYGSSHYRYRVFSHENDVRSERGTTKHTTGVTNNIRIY